MNIHWTLVLEEKVYDRWKHYKKSNPVWTLDELVTRLLENHFDEADAMQKSIEEQERKRNKI